MLMPLSLHVEVIVPVRIFPLRGMSVYEFHGVALRIQSSLVMEMHCGDGMKTSLLKIFDDFVIA